MSTTAISGIPERLFTLAGEYLDDRGMELLRQAYAYAEEHHRGQYRISGDPYITHPVAVAEILAELRMDAVTLTAALLHDVLEDTAATRAELEERFGKPIAELVDGVTKLRHLNFSSEAEEQAENHRKMLLAMARDVRVILIKLADRLHNMRTLKYRGEEDQRRISRETLEIYAPIAHRLGIFKVKWELEDLALRYLNPQQYYRIVHLMKKKRAEREAYIQRVIDVLREKLAEMGIEAEISGRPKHIYSIYRKMYLENKEFNEIYDLLAVRIIVDTIRDCYSVLGIVHTLWKPVPGRFKDYIAMPKANMYQSLHTTVIGPEGEPLEVQIRTHDMHVTAEYGIAAHWAYKEGKGTKDAEEEARRLRWIRELLEYQKESQNALEFVESLKVDIFSDLVFVFTPKGDVVELPAGSTPLDFAYKIHTEIGHRCVGAKVNGKLVPLDTTLKTGDIVEILTSKHSFGPSLDWLKIVKTSSARNKIRAWFKKERREEMFERGRLALEHEARRHGIPLKEALRDEYLREVANRHHFGSVEDLLVAVGYGGMTPSAVLARLVEERQKGEGAAAKAETAHAEVGKAFVQQEARSAVATPARGRVSNTQGVVVPGVDNVLVRLSRCCNPIPGDEIVGFITRGRGISVHRKDCPNVAREDPSRLIELRWGPTGNLEYPVEIEVLGFDRPGILSDVIQAIGESKVNMTEVRGRSDQNRMAHIAVTVHVRDVDHLNRVLDRIRRVRDVYTVRRALKP
ncbi:MAG: bifunctional (p)ppGpp synthetase/guanosine-3',5'-bis(diphosphate) 3'-pyrophosphohydrolase [Brockia lithotrophica]|nr:bifunctional (p)ppGpp synthetase/guanosine-3',5'-bis(diphosphate) 3'-pyrophosphohydrolase [Brockia lithotrophica]